MDIVAAQLDLIEHPTSAATKALEKMPKVERSEVEKAAYKAGLEAAKKKAASQKKKAAPAAKKKAGSKKQASSSTAHAVVDRAKDIKYMSPFGKTNPPVNNNSLGNFVTVPSLARGEIITSTAYGTVGVIIPSYPGSWKMFSWKETDGVYLGGLNLTHLHANPPSSIRPMRAGFKLRNSTQFTNIEGVVRILVASGGLEWAFANVLDTSLDLQTTFITELVTMCSTNPKSVEYTMASLQSEKEFVIPPASMSDYNRYRDFSTESTSMNTIKGLLTATKTDMPMSTVVFHIPKASNTAQNLNLTIGQQDACRFPANELMASLSKQHALDAKDYLTTAVRATTDNGGKDV